MTQTMFDEATLLQEAARIAGSDDFGNEEYRPALGVLLTSFARELGAHEIGAQMFLGDKLTAFSDPQRIAWRSHHR